MIPLASGTWLDPELVSVGTGEVLIVVGAGTGCYVGVVVSTGATTVGCVLLACGPAQAVPASRKPASAAAASERCAVCAFKFSPRKMNGLRGPRDEVTGRPIPDYGKGGGFGGFGTTVLLVKASTPNWKGAKTRAPRAVLIVEILAAISGHESVCHNGLATEFGRDFSWSRPPELSRPSSNRQEVDPLSR